ncbi:MAG: hypothetical protein CMI16_01830 [Opitutaceae bacterium]|nr:hypothetical protein [Opitutaceae bacterium]
MVHMLQTKQPFSKPSVIDWVFRVLGFLVLVVVAFRVPEFPAHDLDSSWRMALGKFFVEGRQFGTEVVFTYGPLGYVMGNTYWGGQWASLISWHAFLAVTFSTIIFWHGMRLSGYNRLFYFTFFFLFGLSYQDAIQQIIIALLGLELIKRSDRSWHWSSLVIVGLLVILSLIKFTNIVLCVALISLAAGLGYWTQRKWQTALHLPSIYAGMFILGWMLCGQHIFNLPAYFHSSWQISQGYQDAMGFSCPSLQLYLGLTVLGLVILHTFINLFSQTNRIRGFALTAGVGAFIYLNWKHGFIRADGHQVGFYFSAMTVIVTSVLMLEDGPKFRIPKQIILTVAGLTALIGMEAVLPGLVSGGLGNTQHTINKNIHFASNVEDSRRGYDARLEKEQAFVEMLRSKSKTKIGDASVDVLGFEQSIAIFNGFNYQPRPVFQGYSAYTPYLSRLNYEYYAGDSAPEYVLFKLQTVDFRLATMDDPHALRMLIQRYEYLFSEQGFTIWQRKSEAFDAKTYEPKFIRKTTVRPLEQIIISDLNDQLIWVEIDYEFNFLGKLRRFFFKPPLVNLRIIDEDGVESVHRLPGPIGRAGFMLNPVINDLLDFMRASGGTPKRRVKAIVIETTPQNLDCLKNEITVSFSSMPPSDAGATYYKEADQAMFHMFVDTPSSYTAYQKPNEEVIDNRRIMIMHAPSEMIFEVPSGAGEINGYYGFVKGAYSDEGKTNGAIFSVIWADENNEPVVLHERFLDPRHKVNDRGLHKFHAKVPQGRGIVYLRIGAGAYNEFAFDWTGWSGIEFK